jgi:hypothetical protein
VHTASTIRHRWRLTRAPESCPRSASRRLVHRQLALHGVDPLISIDPPGVRRCRQWPGRLRGRERARNSLKLIAWRDADQDIDRCMTLPLDLINIGILQPERLYCLVGKNIVPVIGYRATDVLQLSRQSRRLLRGGCRRLVQFFCSVHFISSASGVVAPAIGISNNIVIAAAPGEGRPECRRAGQGKVGCFYLSPTIREMREIGRLRLILLMFQYT